jgi:dolichyl-diphosphooligosaccharide--protein glycosyltransferase
MIMDRKKLLFWIPLGIVLALTLYLDSFPVYFPQLKGQARNIVNESIRRMAIRDIQQKFPNFYPTAKESILGYRIKEYKNLNRKKIKEEEGDIYRQLKQRYQNESGQTYIMELDCWHWGRYVENVVRRGRPGDETLFGKEWDRLMLAPNGYFIQWQCFLYYFSAYLYKFFTIFRPVELYTFLFYLPLFFTTILLVSLYMFSYRYSGPLGAAIGALSVGLAPMFIYRSCAGWFDKDVLNIIFPVAILWTYSISCSDMPFKRRLLWISFSSLLLGLFAFNWTHWWFIFFVILVYEILYLAYLAVAHLYFKKDSLKDIKKHAVSLALFPGTSILFIILFAGLDPLKILYADTISAIFLTTPMVGSVWPNVLYTVGELQRANIQRMCESMGGSWVFASTFICMSILLMRALWHKQYTESKRASIIILAIWFAAMMFASFRGIRFVIFMMVPLGVSTGWLVDEIYKYFWNKKQIFIISLMSIMLAVAGYAYFNRAYTSATNIYPLIDSTWYRVLSIVRDKTPEETVLNSWWDFGDWFKVIGRRRVIFDGQSQDVPQAYWMAKAILAPSEGEAIAILRMINNGGNAAFDIINEHVRDPLEAVLLLETAMMSKSDVANKILTNYLPEYDAQKVMTLLFSNPGRACFVVDDTMVPKTGAISYLGNWDFSRVYIARNLGSKEHDKIIESLVKLGKDRQLMEKFYQEAFLIKAGNLDDWLSNRLQFYSQLSNGKKKDDAILFDNGFIYKPKEKVIYSNSGQIPISLFTLEDGDIKETGYKEANSPYSALVSQEDDGEYRCILLDRELGRSLFSRLYFFKSKGLRHFKSFIDVEEGNRFIRIDDILW